MSRTRAHQAVPAEPANFVLHNLLYVLAHADEMLEKSQVYVARKELLGAMALTFAAKFGYDTVAELLSESSESEADDGRDARTKSTLRDARAAIRTLSPSDMFLRLRHSVEAASTRSTMCTYQLTALLSKRGEFGSTGGGGGGSSEDTAVVFDKLSDTVVTFATLIGMQAEQRAMRCKFVYPLEYPSAFIGHSRGVLMYGPPGTGKTQLARACANELGASDTASSVIFRSMTAASMKGKYVGETEKNIRNLFAAMSAEITAREKSTGRSPGVGVLFIDEVDTVAGQRDGEDKTMALSVNALLQAMDGTASDKRISVMAATNLLESLDPAFLSRMDTKIEIGMPTWQDQRKLLLQNMFSWINGNDYKLRNGVQCAVTEPASWVNAWEGTGDGDAWLLSHAWAFMRDPVTERPAADEVKKAQLKVINATINSVFTNCSATALNLASVNIGMASKTTLIQNSSVGGTGTFTFPWPLFGLAHRDGGALHRRYATEAALRATTTEIKDQQPRAFVRKFRNCGIFYAATKASFAHGNLSAEIAKHVFDDSVFSTAITSFQEEFPIPAVYVGGTEVGVVINADHSTRTNLTAITYDGTGLTTYTVDAASPTTATAYFKSACGSTNSQTEGYSTVLINVKWLVQHDAALGKRICDRMRVMTIDTSAFQTCLEEFSKENETEQRRRFNKEKARRR